MRTAVGVLLLLLLLHVVSLSRCMTVVRRAGVEEWVSLLFQRAERGGNCCRRKKERKLPVGVGVFQKRNPCVEGEVVVIRRRHSGERERVHEEE